MFWRRKDSLPLADSWTTKFLHCSTTAEKYTTWAIRIGIYIYTYRVFHDLWTLLQEVISYIFVIKKVHINMCPILDGYRVMGIFLFPYTPSCEPCLTEPAGEWCTQLGGLSFVLQAFFLPPDSPTQLQTVQFLYLNTWRVFKECGGGGVGGYSPG